VDIVDGRVLHDFSASCVYLASGGYFATNRGPVKNTPQAFQASPHSSGKGSRPDEPPRGRSAAEHQDSSNNYEARTETPPHLGNEKDNQRTQIQPWAA